MLEFLLYMINSLDCNMKIHVINHKAFQMYMWGKGYYNNIEVVF